MRPDPKSPSTPQAAGLQAVIEAGHAKIGIMGMGYVGLPLAAAMEQSGFEVRGFDVDPVRVEQLRTGQTYLGPMNDRVFTTLAASKKFSATSTPGDLAGCDVIILCVPTPLNEAGEPDLSHVVLSTKYVASILVAGMLVVLESTTWPGTTREVVLPILEESGLQCGRDFFVAYSPERENPGDTSFGTTSIPRVVGGIENTSRDIAALLYGRIGCEVVPVASIEVSEASKIVENVYRCVNIALVNELKVAFEKMNIDVWDVIRAASTKPFGYQSFWPGPGLGGHCIPIDPFYLSWRAKQCGGEARLTELAGEINTAMPRIVVDRTCEALEKVEGRRVLIIGVAYKPNVSDIRETPAAPIIEMLQERGCDVSYHDPHCPEFRAMKRYTIDLQSVPLDTAHVSRADVVLIVTNHDAIDWAVIGQHASLIVDTRNAMNGIEVSGRIVKA